MSLEFVHGLHELSAPPKAGAAVTIGTFDGIHRGHQEILRQLQAVADENGLSPVLVTFDPHPRLVVTPDDAPPLLTTLPEKERFLPDFLDGKALILKFDEQLRSLTAEEFVTGILIERLNLRHLVVGYDHTFGRGRSGTIVELSRMGQKYGFDVQVVKPVSVDGTVVSSSEIRRTLQRGDMPRATKLLGHPYAICGKVGKGIGLGRKLGYPTANVDYHPRKCLPKAGVYSCRVSVGDSRHQGMMFIGRNQFNPERPVTVEANIFNFDRDLYGQPVAVYPMAFIRANRRFDSADALARQIDQDKQQVLRISHKENVSW